MKNNRGLAALLASLVVMTCGGAAISAPFTVDGRLNDWGITLGDNNTSNLGSAAASTGAIPVTCFASGVCEDQNDSSNSHAVGPHYGGQNYDVEFLGVRREGGRIFIGIASGLRPDNGFSLYGPGDLFLTVNGVAYAIEIGGGAGGDAGSAAPLHEGAAGSTYVLNSSGYTTGHALDVVQTVGSIWRGTDINTVKDPITHTVDTQFTRKAGTSALATADYVFTRNQTPNAANNGMLAQHSVIEMSFDVALFGDVNEVGVYWGPVCSNDGLSYAVLLLPPDDHSVPEPGSLALFALGLAGFGYARRRRS